MATVYAVPQARNHLSCRSRGNDSGTVHIVSPLPYNPAHARSFAHIRSKKPIPTSNDLPALHLDAFLGHKRDHSSDAISYRDQVFPGFVQFHVFEALFHLIDGQEEEIFRLTDLGHPTSISAEHAKATVHYTTTAWMPFDASEGPNRPILLNLSYALFPHAQPTRDFSVVLSRFLRYSDFATGNRHGWLISDAKGGS